MRHGSATLTLLLAAAGCADEPAGTPWAWNLPPDFPLPVVPADNPVTVEKVELGRHLFYDTRLSADGTVACASCHHQARAFTDPRPASLGVRGDVLARNAMSIDGVAYLPTLTWFNPVLRSLEQQALVPLFGEAPPEHGLAGREGAVLAAFRADARYRALFAAAYPDAPDPFTVHHVVRAIATFERVVISADSPYDRSLRGQRDAIDARAQRGEALFFSESLECYHCHVGPTFTVAFRSVRTQTAPLGFENNGLYSLDALGRYPAESPGLSEFSDDPRDHGRMRVPTLRNIAVTAPYMHDGSLPTLDAVLDHYARGGTLTVDGPRRGDGRANPNKSSLLRGFTLTADERADVIAFLRSLTDERFLRDPRFADPFTNNDGGAPRDTTAD